MPNLFFSKVQRGPTLKVIISIIRMESDTASMQTDVINVDGKVEIMLKIKMYENSFSQIIPSISMRKIAGAQSDSTLIKILSGKFNKQFFCSDDWLEAEMGLKDYENFKSEYVIISGNRYNACSYAYYIEVNITVHLLGSTVMLPNYNLYEDTEFTDFQLQGIDGEVAVHKTTLMAQSDVFKSIMRGEWKEKAEGHMKVEGVTVKTLQHLKDYMYLGILPDEGLDLLLLVAARYLMDTLMSLCITKLVESMKPEDFDGLVKFAFQHNMLGLVKALVFQIPDEIINDIYKLKINDQESKDNEQ